MTTPAAHSILCGDALQQLRTIPDNSVHCCVTSPPYWQLRDYGVPGQLGLEPTIQEYVASIRAVFAEVRRVLRKDGTCWVNLGDCYASGGHGGDTGKSKTGGKPKDLCGIPWRVAFALQDDGWYLRSDIIWHKPNPMPESTTDRPTKAHEYLFLLAKSQRYFYDAQAIKEPVSGTANARGHGVNPKSMVAPTGWDTRPGRHRELKGRYKVKQNESFSGAINGPVSQRNKRSVWTIPTHAYPGNHYATYPPNLVKPCILAGTSAYGCCSSCGSPYTRTVENGQPDLDHQRACGGDINGEYHGTATKNFAAANAQDASATKARILRGMVAKITTGWIPSCPCSSCPCPPTVYVIPATVLDPFAGSGTTALVASELGRSSIMIELDPDQAKTIRQRLNSITPGLALA